MKKVVLIGLLLTVCALVGCGGSSSSGGGNNPPAVTLVSIQVTPATPSITVKGTQQFTATGTYSDGSTKVLTTTANWLSATQSVATINTGGLATAVAAGSTNITATSGNIVGTTTLTVINPLVSIAVTPATATVAPSSAQQFTATGTYADASTKDITSSVTWSASSGATITSGGLATAGTAGATVTVTATSGTISGTAALTVNALVSIAVTPATASVAPNGTQQFTATGTYYNGSTQNITNSVTWSASLGATITSGGLATGNTPGTSTIMATSGSISGTAILTITNPIVSIAVTPANPSMPAGITLQFTATATFFDHTTGDVTSTSTWTSSDPTVATVSSQTPTQGLATSVTAGTTTIQASSGGVNGSTILTVSPSVLQSIAIGPSNALNATISLRDQQAYTATGTYTNPNGTFDVTNSATWSSSKPAVATITTGGFATGIAPGSTTIGAALGGKTDSTSLTVNADNVVSIAITPNPAPNTLTLAQGTSQSLTATGNLANGSTLNITSLVSWSTSSTTVAPVSTSGLLKAGFVAVSTSETISATLNTGHGQIVGTLPVSISPATITSVTVTPISPTIAPGTRQGFTATGGFSDGSSQSITNDCSWSSDNTAVATTSGPTATGVAAGTANIKATFIADTTKTGSAVLTVSNATLVSFSISPTSSLLAPSTTQGFSATGTFSSGPNQSLSGSALVWKTSDASVVTITSGGFATGQMAGNAVISATYNGMPSTNTASVIVESTQLQTINVTPPTATVPETISTNFVATGVFGDSSQQNLTSFVTWGSTPATVATISSSGRATGLSSVGSPATITAAFGGVVGTASLAVTPATLQSIKVTPPSATVNKGSTQQFTATGTFSDNTTLNLTSQVTWSSSDVTKAVINASGVATGTATGTTNITATLNGVTSSAVVLTVN